MTCCTRLGSLLAVTLFALAGCGPVPPDGSNDEALTDLSYERLSVHDELRDAREVPGGVERVINLGTVPERGVLRLGLLAGDSESSAGTVRVYVDERLVQKIELGEGVGWADHRIELAAESAGGTCRLVFNSKGPVYLGPCEVLNLAAQDAPPPNVLVYLIDTLRQDHLGCYGYDRDTSPNIDALAAEGVLMTQLMPQSSWTRPSVASLFTSAYPSVHGAENSRDKLRDGLPNLAGALAAQGYETLGLMTNSNCLPLWGFGEGFTRYVSVHDRFSEDVWLDRVVVDTAIETLDEVAGRPWFLYVHAMGPHVPYDPPKEFAARFAADEPSLTPKGGAGEPGDFRNLLDVVTSDEYKLKHLMDLYDGDIACSDYHFGRLVDHMKEQGLYDNTWIVVLSDHGEEFLDHGAWEHGHTLYEELLRVPLIIKPPTGQFTAPRRLDDLVEMVDVAPTILDALGAPAPADFQGRSFLGLLRGEEGAFGRIGYASLNLDWHSMRTAKTLEHKFIRDLASGEDHRYDLVADPKEQRALPESPQWAEALERHAVQRSLAGASGLHLLIVAGETLRDVTGSVIGPDLGAPEFDGFAWHSQIDREDEAIRLSLSGDESAVLPGHLSDTRSASRRKHAYVRIPVQPDAPVSIDLRVEGRPIGEGNVFAGNEMRHVALDGSPLALGDLIGHPDNFDLSVLPEKFGVYLWYVPGADRVQDSDIPPEMLEELRALGYVD